MEENHLGATRPWAESLRPLLVSWAVPRPTSVGCRGRDGGTAAGATSRGVQLSPTPCTRPSHPQEVPSPQTRLHRTAFRGGLIRCSCGAMVAGDCQDCRGVSGGPRRLQTPLGWGVESASRQGLTQKPNETGLELGGRAHYES